MADTNLSHEFYGFLEKYEIFYKEFLLLESEKYEIITRNEYRLLDDYIKNEQVFLLKSRGLDMQRNQYLERLGSKDLTLKEFIDSISDKESKETFQKLYERLSEILLNLKEANRLSNFLIELRLHKIDTNLKKLDNHSETEKIYSTHIEKNKAINSISKKV